MEDIPMRSVLIPTLLLLLSGPTFGQSTPNPRHAAGASAAELAYDAEFFPGASYDPQVPAPERLLGFRLGDRAAFPAEVERCISRGRDCPGFFMAVGNHIPANTPVENALYYNEVYEEFSRR